MDYEPFIDIDNPPKIALPKGWPAFVRESILHIIAMARISIMYARDWPEGMLRNRGELDRLNNEILLLRMEVDIKDARIELIDPHRRPNYTPNQRLQILQLRAARGWNKTQLAR